MAGISETEKTLYARLGGYDVIAAEVDEFLQTLSSDPQDGAFLRWDESRKTQAQPPADSGLSLSTGGPTLYLGQDMKIAHEGLGTSTSDWQIAMDHVQRAMTKLKLPDKESKELMAVFSSVADQIIER